MKPGRCWRRHRGAYLVRERVTPPPPFSPSPRIAIAPSQKGCVANGQITKASHKQAPPSPSPLPPPHHPFPTSITPPPPLLAQRKPPNLHMHPHPHLSKVRNLQLSRPPKTLVLNLGQIDRSVVGEVVEHVVGLFCGLTPLLVAKNQVHPVVKVLRHVVGLRHSEKIPRRFREISVKSRFLDRIGSDWFGWGCLGLGCFGLVPFGLIRFGKKAPTATRYAGVNVKFGFELTIGLE